MRVHHHGVNRMQRRRQNLFRLLGPGGRLNSNVNALVDWSERFIVKKEVLNAALHELDPNGPKARDVLGRLENINMKAEQVVGFLTDFCVLSVNSEFRNLLGRTFQVRYQL